MKISELFENELPDDNFTAADLENLSKITDVNAMKAMAKSLIATPSKKPMKPQKIAWLNHSIDSKKNTQAVVKLMYDLLLGGEGHSVIGSKSSMAPNSYRRTFGETN
jgi:hypothetical protein